MHEMEGPYPISQRQTPLPHAQHPCRSINHQAGHPPEVPVTQFLLRPGVPPGWFPFSVVRDFYALQTGLHKGLRPAISRFFSRPQIVHSSAEVIPLLAQILHRKSTDRAGQVLGLILYPGCAAQDMASTI